MVSRFPDPDMAAFRGQLALRGGAEPLELAAVRSNFERQHGAIPAAEGCSIEAIDRHGARGEQITPSQADRGAALLYHHGGGYLFGSSRSHRHLVSRLAKAAGVVGFNMDYRLAPEHPYPAALEDGLRNYRHVLDQGFEPDRIVLAGESAGGNLTAALLLRIRAEGLPSPAGAFLLSPWLDMTQAGASYDAKATSDPILSQEAMKGAAEQFLGQASALDPMTSPIKADLQGLPPLFIQVGSDEVLLSDSLDFARNAALAGVDVRLHVWAEMVHAWPLFHFALPTSGLAAIDEAAAWISLRSANQHVSHRA